MQFVFAAESALDESLPGKETARLLNMYPEKGGSRGPVTLRGAPGLQETTSLGAGRVRAMISASDGLYAAVGGKLVRWDGATTSVLGSFPDGVTTMARDANEIAIVVGGRYYVWDGSALTPIAGQSFVNIGSVDYLNGFFLLTQIDGESLAWTSPTQASSLDAFDFASAESSPDKLRRVIVNGNLVWLMGEDSIEPWQNTGNLDAPFAPIPSTRLEKGLRSTAEVVQLDNTFMWVSPEGRVYRQEELRPVNIGTDAVSAALNASADVTCFAYQFNNHDFLCMRFGDRPAWVYDPSTGALHERSSGPTHKAWEVTATVHHEGTWYAGTQTGELCTFGGYQDRGNELRREATSAILANGGERFTVGKVDIRTEGTGEIMMRLSRDSRVFGRERIKPFGAAYRDRCTFRALGQGREFSMQLACTDNTDFAIHAAEVQAA